MPACKHCGKLYREGMAVCSRCGKRLPQKASLEISQLTVRESHTCGACNGTGKSYRNKECEACGGSGKISLVDCPDCKGSGIDSNQNSCDTCKGKGILSNTEAKEVLGVKQSCSKFIENPLASLIIPVICIIVIAFSARVLWGCLFVDVLLFSSTDGFLSAIALLIAFSALSKKCFNYIRGSQNDTNKGTLQSAGIILLGIGILAALLAGPIAGNKYNWIEGESLHTINKKILKGKSIQCLKVDITKNVKDIYFGSAKLSDGSEMSVIATYKNEGSTGSGKHRHIKYKVTVDLQ